MNGDDILSLPIALPDGVDYDDYVIGTYLVSYPAALPVPIIAPFLAIEQSTGTWVPVPGETPEVRCRHIAKVLGVYEMPDYEFTVPPNLQNRQWFVQVAYPEVNIGEQIPMLLTTVVGKLSMGGAIKLVEI